MPLSDLRGGSKPWMKLTYSFASQILNEVSAVIRDGVIADNAVVRVWKDSNGGQLISSCVKGV